MKYVPRNKKPETPQPTSLKQFEAKNTSSLAQTPLRLMFYDDTCRGPGPLPGLSTTWDWGGKLYGALGRFDAWCGVQSWEDGFDWLLQYAPGRKIQEIQYWGHGEWGGLWLDWDLIKIDMLSPEHPLFERLDKLRGRLVGEEALWWFRCCDVFGNALGHEFARKWTRFFNCRAAGHTYQIKLLQSGLHVLEAGAEPHWPVDEGVMRFLSHGMYSHPWAPKTITFLDGKLP